MKQSKQKDRANHLRNKKRSITKEKHKTRETGTEIKTDGKIKQKINRNKHSDQNQ